MTRPAPGTRWIRKRGKHAEAEIEVSDTNGVSVFFQNRGGGVAMGNQKVDENRTHSLAYDIFMTQYVPKSSLLPGDAHGGGSFRRVATAKQPPVEATPLSLNGLDLGQGAPLSIEIMEISPATAQAWLARGGNNRVPTKGRVNRYANAIRRGEWRLTGDTIKLDAQGRVRDGKHRLSAVVAAGLTIRSVVIRGVGEEDFTVFDTGKNRTPGDVLGIAGYQNRVALASAARGLVLIEASGRLDPPNRKELDPLISHTALLRYVKEHDEVEDGVLLANKVRSAGLAGGAGLLGILLVLLLRVDRDATYIFAESLSTGAQLERDSPILRFRNRLITDKRMPNGLADREHLVALGIKAWNAWRAGEQMQQLTWHAQRGPGTRAGEAFPVAK